MLPAPGVANRSLKRIDSHERELQVESQQGQVRKTSAKRTLRKVPIRGAVYGDPLAARFSPIKVRHPETLSCCSAA